MLLHPKPSDVRAIVYSGHRSHVNRAQQGWLISASCSLSGSSARIHLHDGGITGLVSLCCPGLGSLIPCHLGQSTRVRGLHYNMVAGFQERVVPESGNWSCQSLQA